MYVESNIELNLSNDINVSGRWNISDAKKYCLFCSVLCFVETNVLFFQR